MDTGRSCSVFLYPARGRRLTCQGRPNVKRNRRALGQGETLDTRNHPAHRQQPYPVRAALCQPLLTACPGRSKNGKQVSRETMRPVEEWIALPPCPPVITKEMFEEIQMQIQRNKAESLRNNKHIDRLGLLRAGYIFCGICGRKMYISYPSKSFIRNRKTYPSYLCRRSVGGDGGVVYNHRTQINLPYMEQAVKEHIAQVLKNPELIRARVDEIRNSQKPPVDTTSIEATIAQIDQPIQNFYKLAQQATTDDMVAGLAQQMNQLEQQKAQAKAMLHDIADDEEKRIEVEVELVKFETWANNVRPFLSDPEYLRTASYDELRLAVRILGIRVTVYPTQGDWPYRFAIDIAVPETENPTA